MRHRLSLVVCELLDCYAHGVLKGQNGSGDKKLGVFFIQM